MSIRTILTGEDEPVLHKVCHPVTSFDQKLADLLDDMKETLAKANGVGLAAPQVGILRRAVIVVNDQDEMLELVNPEILDQKGEQDGLEAACPCPASGAMSSAGVGEGKGPGPQPAPGSRWRAPASPPAASATS